MVASEIFPLAQTGGLADMVGALSSHLVELGLDVTAVMPAYQTVLENLSSSEETGMEIEVPVGERRVRAEILKIRLGEKLAVYLIRQDSYFLRDNLYGTSEGDYPDNAERFAFFSKAALDLAQKTAPWDVIHCHDWQTALMPFLKKIQPDLRPEVHESRTLLTLHNVAYQGSFPASVWGLLNLDSRYFTPGYLEFYGNVNLLKGGIVTADALSTVSRSYAREILSPDYGFGLEGVLRSRKEDLYGILNGVDYREWNPETDRYIRANYGPRDLRGKAICKRDLQKLYGLPARAQVPLIGMVTRLAAQKGLEIVADAMEELMRLDVQLVILGSGDRRYQELFVELSARHSQKMGAKIGFDHFIAHKIEAGSDLYLMPSRYEPCGLNQIYSLKYGTIPIVRATGGLNDSIGDYQPLTGRGNGFKFNGYSSSALSEAIKRAIAVFSHKRAWRRLITNAMVCDFSWQKSAPEYVALYRKLRTGSP